MRLVPHLAVDDDPPLPPALRGIGHVASVGAKADLANLRERRLLGAVEHESPLLAALRAIGDPPAVRTPDRVLDQLGRPDAPLPDDESPLSILLRWERHASLIG